MADMGSDMGQNDFQRASGPQKQCKKCGASIPKYSESCPQCGANLKPVYKKVWFWLIIVLVVLFALIGGCVNSCGKALEDSTNTISTSDGTSGSGSSATETSSSTDTSSSAQKYTVTDEQIVDKGYGMYVITGTFTNTSGKEMSLVNLEYVVTDASGAQTGTAYANTTNLADQTAWKFEAYVTSSGDQAPAAFQLKDVTGF